jgi:hypothetical protein
VTHDERLSIIYSKLAVMQGCAHAIDFETRNTADSRHKGRMIQRNAEEIMDLLREAQKLVVLEEMDRSARNNAGQLSLTFAANRVFTSIFDRRDG